MIQGFYDEETKVFFETAKTKAGWLNASERLLDLKRPPNNRLEALKGRRRGQYSIRINDQWRICFIWTDAGPKRVEITDHH